MIRQFELVESVKAYDPAADEDALNRAYVFSMQAHGAQTRASGDPYFTHPLEVAGILTRYKLDSASIVTALLHDTLEDTSATEAEIRRQFGDEIYQLVDGVTKLSKLELQSSRAKQAENFRKLVLAMSRDIRVLLVKLADRLHNMRTLHFIENPEKRARIARETMEIYAPLAERIGMNDIKDELEDLSFAEINPDARESVLRRLKFLRNAGSNLVGRVLDELRRVLAEENIEAAVFGREKKPYSVWRKMQRQRVGFEQLSDIMAFRVVVQSVPDCYRTLGIIHGRYPVVPGRFKDYISTPKPNGYRSLHTAVLGPENQRIEVQIRTQEMHDVAERGVAAHWHFKQTDGTGPVSSAYWQAEGRQYRWLQELLDIIESAAGPEEFLEHTRLEMFSDQVFCFSPKGDVYALPRGSTTIDFAYGVHTDLGDHCVGAKVNGRLVPLRTHLQNGDQVDILTSKGQTPAPEWEQFVVSGKAKSRIRRFLRVEQKEQYARLGRQIVEKAFKRHDEAVDEKALAGVLKEFHAADLDDLYAQVGQGVHTGHAVVRALHPKVEAPKAKETSLFGLGRARRRKSARPDEHSVPISGLTPGVAVHLAKCCYPLPGDRIVGIVTTGKGVTVHTIDCLTLEAFADSPERWLDVAWDKDPDEADRQVARINVTLLNEPGALGRLANVIAASGGNISNLQFTNRNPDFFDMNVDIEVDDTRQLNGIVAALRSTDAVNAVKRTRS
jgi:guanosine-3',5'-bis(diphosphate) 3'-pyrophosphohydrolase